MPSVSTAERRATAIALHHPEQLFPRNRGLLRMTHAQLRGFARTKETGLPHYAGGQKKKRRLSTRLAELRGSGAFRT